MKTEQYWLIWSMEHRAWWRANSNGYTLDRVSAGRYSLGEACAIVRNANRAPELKNKPNEAMILDEPEAQ